MNKFVQSFEKFNFRLLFVLLGLTVFIYTNAIADEFEYSDSWGKAGYTLETQSATKVVINFSIEEFALTSIDINGESMLHVELQGHLLPNNEGAPDLPGAGRYIAVPQGASASYKVVSCRTETLTNVYISPAPRIPWETEKGPLEYNKDESIYSANKFYPDKPVQISELYDIRKVDVVMLGITPFQYNPITKELIIYRDLKIEVTFTGGNGHFGENRYRSRWWDPMLSDMLLNYKSLPEIDYNKSSQGLKDTGCEYLIITPNGAEFQQWADSIRVFRTLQGILTDVVTLNEIGGNTASIIENYIDNAYNTWDIPPVACLLLADYGTNANNSIISPYYYDFCISDNVYADVEGVGIPNLPDIVFARMTAQNATHLETMVTKFLNHERTPPTNPAYYNNPITALGFELDRWFQICSESVAGFWEVIQGKTTTRVNVGNCGTTWSTGPNTSTVLNIFGPNGLGYIPATPDLVNCSWNGTAGNVISAINSGAFMLLHRDHGMPTGWTMPYFTNININSLNNTDLTFIWSINCLTGKFNYYYGECFAEKFHRHTSGGNNAGALGIIAASGLSYSFVNDTYAWGAFDNMWPDFLPDIYAPQVDPEPRGVLPGFGNAAGKYFLKQSNWPYNYNYKNRTYHLFHHHGDAFMTVYSEIPQNLTVTHNPTLYVGFTSFDVTANEGSLIALTVNGEIIGTAEGTGAPLTIIIPGQIPPDQMLVTITKQNYYRYESTVDVILPAGPYVVRESYTINDNTGGNGNGLMDYGETNLLSLTVENIGMEQADNVVVTLSTEDDYITITDSTENYGNIAAGATAVVPDGFAYDVANDLPDSHIVSFEVSATDGINTWVSSFEIEGHAPILEFINFTISDPTGNNNGKLDPGETADINIGIENTGTSEAFNILGELTETDPYLTLNTGQVSYGNLTGGGNATGSFSVTAAGNTPAGHIVDFTFDITADLGITGSGTFNVVVSQIPVLILDLDGNGNSAPAMETAMNTLDIAYDKLSSFPPDLNLYSTIFACLGIYASNHVLSSSEGQLLADYLNNGGNLYMEGGDTWYFDPSTSVHAMFNINPTSDGTSDMGTVLGQTGTFTEGMSFNYSGDNSYMDHIDPVSPAFMIFENQSPNYGTGVAYDEGSYRTIGTSHEFGGLDDGTSPSTKEELMEEYLDFLGISTSLQAGFGSSTTATCEGETVEFYDQSSGDIISWEWIFEGGSPGTSSFQNPTVMYFNEGTYDVTLTVSDGVENSTLLIEDYITVASVPEAPDAPTGITMLCANWGNSTYTTSGTGGATSYSWLLDPANAGTITGTGTSITVEWEAGFLGDADLTVAGENYCGAGPYSDPLVITRYLPDVTLEPFDDVCLTWPAFELTGGMPEGGEYSGAGVSNGWFDPSVAGLGTHTITYTYIDPNDCDNFAEETIYVDPCPGINENMDDPNVMIFPNPNDGSFTLKLNLDNNDIVDLKIFNSLNEIVFEDDNIATYQDYAKEINLSKYAKGIYYLRITRKETNLVKKIIIR